MDFRSLRESDSDQIVSLSLRAWAPVFDAELDTIGAELFGRLEGDDGECANEGMLRTRSPTIG